MTTRAKPAPGRRRGLMLALVLTLGATTWFALQDEEAMPPAPAAATIGALPVATESAAPRKAATPASATWPEPPTPRRPHWAALAPAAGSAWAPPPTPPPPVQSKRPSAATALVGPMPLKPPPFPYTLIGRLDDGQAHALLSGPLRSFGVKVADVIDGQWRVDDVQARGITITWLPGGVKTTLVFASL